MPSPAQIAKNKLYFLFKDNPEKAIIAVLDAIQKAGEEAKNEVIEKARMDFELHISKMEGDHNQMMKELMDSLKIQLDAKMQALPLLKGEKGDKPIAGVDYPIPKDGRTPIKGVDYFNGEDGTDGTNPNPEDVVPLVIKKLPKDELKAEQIAAKLNTLEEKIDRKVIKGLDRELRVMQQNIKSKTKQAGGGGGMGNVVHQSFTVTSATTTVTLSNGIAANGFAIWAYLDGQFIARGTHYTQSGKVLTLTFAVPEEGAHVIDVTYIRA